MPKASGSSAHLPSVRELIVHIINLDKKTQMLTAGVEQAEFVAILAQATNLLLSIKTSVPEAFRRSMDGEAILKLFYKYE